MEYDPSVNIKKTDLIILFKKYDLSTKYIDNFLADAAIVACTNRSVVYATNQKMLNSFYSKVEVSKELIFEFNGYLVSLLKERLKGKRKVNTINQSSVQYRVLKEVTVLALEFCEVYNLQTNVGFIKYIKLGFEVIGKGYRLNKFIYKHPEILDYYSNVLAYKDNPNEKLTKKIHKTYCNKIYKIRGYKVDYESSIQSYINFVYAAEEVVKYKSNFKVWVESQFEELKFLDVVPEIGALHGTKAKARYDKFCINNPIQEKAKDKHSKIVRKLAKATKKKREKLKEKYFTAVSASSGKSVTDRINERLNTEK